MNQAFLTPEPTSIDDGPPRVLVIEDDPVIRRLLRQRLHRSGLTVVDARCGEDAIELCQGAPSGFRLVVTDGVMPGIDGFEVARYFERESPATRVILVSGFLHHFVSRPDIPENIDAFFEKPFRPEEIVAKVHELLESLA
ncbi:MAG: response regulator [Opitutaceae bacterium]